MAQLNSTVINGNLAVNGGAISIPKTITLNDNTTAGVLTSNASGSVSITASLPDSNIASASTWNNKSTVSASTTGSSTTEVKYITINGTEYKLGGGDGDHYPTTFTWTAGTTAGPTGSLTGNSGFSAVSFEAIPAANGITQSGIVTTEDQELGGLKTLHDGIKLGDSSYGVSNYFVTLKDDGLNNLKIVGNNYQNTSSIEFMDGNGLNESVVHSYFKILNNPGGASQLIFNNGTGNATYKGTLNLPVTGTNVKTLATTDDIPQTYVSSVNGSSGAITNVAKTDVQNNFTVKQTISDSTGGNNILEIGKHSTYNGGFQFYSASTGSAGYLTGFLNASANSYPYINDIKYITFHQVASTHTADLYRTILISSSAPTMNRTLTLPDKDGILATTDDGPQIVDLRS